MGMRLLVVLALAATVSVACASPSSVGAGAGGTASPSTSVVATASGPSPASPTPRVSDPDPSNEPISSGSGGGGPSSDTCSGFAVSIAHGAKGKPTAALAVAAWLAGKPQGFNPDLAAWHRSGPALSDSVRYAAGRAHVIVSHIGSPGSGWIVTEGATCP